MSFKVFSLRMALGLATVVALIWAAGAAWAGPQIKHYSLTGNGRWQVGNGLPIPIDFQPAPNGKVVAVPSATVMQTSSAPAWEA